MEKKESDKGVVHNLNESINYSNESIVSKTFLNKQTGTVTLFAFDQGQGLSEHSAPFDAMVQVIEGEGYIYIDKKVNIISAGEFIIMPANIPHSLEAREQFKMLLTMIKSD